MAIPIADDMEALRAAAKRMEAERIAAFKGTPFEITTESPPCQTHAPNPADVLKEIMDRTPPPLKYTLSVVDNASERLKKVRDYCEQDVGIVERLSKGRFGVFERPQIGRDGEPTGRIFVEHRTPTTYSMERRYRDMTDECGLLEAKPPAQWTPGEARFYSMWRKLGHDISRGYYITKTSLKRGD